jgi:hypothetical protein
MRKITLAASLIIAPAIVHAQNTVQAKAGINTSVSGASGSHQASASGASSAQVSTSTPRSQSSTEASGAASGGEASSSNTGARRLSADAQARVDANLRAARARKLPEEPIRQRVAEGQAKGASDAQIAAASGRTLVDMQSAFEAMVKGGHASPSDAEVARGASLIARGYSTVQLEGVARNAGSDRSLTTAFDALTSLQARGVSNANAVAQVQSQLAAHASDAQLGALATNGSTMAGVGGTVTGSQGSGAASAAGNASAGIAGSAAAGAGAAASGAISGAASGAGATGGVSGAVHGVLGKP